MANTRGVRRNFGSKERGASIIEYCILISLLAFIIIVAGSALGGSAFKVFRSAGQVAGGDHPLPCPLRCMPRR